MLKSVALVSRIEDALPVRLSQKDAIRRKDLAKLIVEAAFTHLDRLGVSVKLHGDRGGFLLNPTRFGYYHCDAP